MTISLRSIALASFVGFPIVVLAADVGKIETGMMGPQIGQTIHPKVVQPVWDGAPSRVWGQWLNDKGGHVDPNTGYTILEKKLIPSIGGNTLWVRIEPENQQQQDFCMSHQCWAEYGKIEKDLTFPVTPGTELFIYK